jgi:hypothetical protein
MRRALVADAAGRFVVAGFIRATDPRNAGKAHLYALNKIPGAESACGMKAGKSRKTGKCSSLWNISLYMSYIAISFHSR